MRPGDRGPTSRGCASSPCSSTRVALLVGEIKIGRVLLEGADILVEHNDVGDTNLEMLPPPDGSGPRAVRAPLARLRTAPAFPWIGTIEVRDSVLTINEGAGRPPVVLEIPTATFALAGAQPAIADRGPLRRAPGCAARPHRARPARSTAG